MLKTDGYSLNIGRGTNGKWKIQFIKLPVATVRPMIDGEICWAGVRLDLVWGPLVLPIGKWYNWKYWRGDKTLSPWNSGNQWFTIKIPRFCFLFLSVMMGEWKFGVPGFWLGARTANLKNKVDYQLRIDWEKSEYDNSAWAWDENGEPVEAWPVGKYKGCETVELTLAIRSDFKH